MKYDNIEFDNMKDLFDYRQLEKKTKQKIATIPAKVKGFKKSRKYKYWTDKETLFIKQLYESGKSVKYMMMELKRSQNAIYNKIYHMKLMNQIQTRLR